MKIGIVGAHGVGKTTLARELAKRLNLTLVPDTAAEAFHKGWAVNEKTTVENQFWILSKQIEYEREIITNFIADKTLYDNIVYSKYIFEDPEIHSVINKIVLANSNYHLLIYIPIEIELVDDGRSVDPVFQKLIDKEYIRVLKSMGLQYHEVRGSVEERVNKSLQIISKVLQK